MHDGAVASHCHCDSVPSVVVTTMPPGDAPEPQGSTAEPPATEDSSSPGGSDRSGDMPGAAHPTIRGRTDQRHHGHETDADAHDVARHARRLQARALRDRLRENMLFLPVLLLAGTVALELLVGELDDRYPTNRWPLTFELATDAAVALLGTIAGATITTAGVVFSLLVVSLQLASGQFSPRVLRGFWRDRFGQVLIGLLLATFTYCVLALSRIDTAADFAPALTLDIAIVLAVASIVAIVSYLNRISRSQYVGNITERVARETLSLVAELPYGPRVGRKVGSPAPVPDLTALGDPLIVRSPANGWVQQISRRGVIGAVPDGSVVRLDTRVGAFLVKGAPLATVWPRPAHPRRVADLLDKALVIGTQRTMQQDIDFGLRQLNDVALRALSPAVNDPTTAIEVIVRIATIMRPLLCRPLPDQVVRDADGNVLLTPWDIDHNEYVSHAFDQLRVYAAPHPQVATALMRTIRMLIEACEERKLDDRLPALQRQIQLTLTGCRNAGMLPEDLATVAAAASTEQVTAGHPA